MRGNLQRLAVSLVLCVAPAAAFAAGDGAGDIKQRMMLLVIQVGIILFAARLGNMLFELAHLPGALGELLVGIVIGPYALGQLALPGFPGGFFPLPAGTDWPISPELNGLRSIAAIVLLFSIGLETDLRLLVRFSVAGGLVGLGGIAASFVLGAATAVFFGGWILGQTWGLFDTVPLLLGVITTATSVGITARILSERRRLDSPEGMTILSAAVFDDVLGIVLLAVVMGVIRTSGAAAGVEWGRIGWIAIKALGVWLTATALGLLASRRISVLLKAFGDRTSIAVLALGLALILAGLFEEAGLAMIIGAYVMGLSLSKSDISHVVQERLHSIYALLVPVFFCTTGMFIELEQLRTPAVVAFGVAYAVVALAAKVLGCGLPAWLTSFNLRGAARVGFGMAPRCEVALVIAGVAQGVGFPASLMAAVILMVLVNTLVAPPALVFLYRGDRRGTRRPLRGDEAQTTVSFDFPSGEMAEFFVSRLQRVFEAEGFFVHQLSRTRGVYETRKEDTVIGFRREEAQLTFRCKKEDAHFVNAAVYEGLAMLEQAVQGLRKPMDTSVVTERFQQAGPAGRPSLRLSDYLSPRLIRPDLTGQDKGQVIDELLDVLARSGLVADVEAARDAVWRREQSMTTGLQDGVAIPHGRTDAVDRLVCAAGVHREGVDFQAVDGQPSHIFILALSPHSKPAPHVQFMSTISQALDAGGRERVLAARTAVEVYRALTAPAPPAAPPRPPRAPGERFDMCAYIRPEVMVPRLAGQTKEAIIGELVARLGAAGLVRDVSAATQTVREREGVMSTAMERGIAVPHGRTDAVDRLVCAVGLRPGGIDFGAADGQKTDIFALVLTPRSGADPYLQFVASLMNVLDEEGRRCLRAAETPEAMADALTCRADAKPAGGASPGSDGRA